MTYIEKHIVAPNETAAQVGSGLLPVYATPQVVALMEHAACALIQTLPPTSEHALPEGDTTVGTHMTIDHVKACLVGVEVTCKVDLLEVNGRQYLFSIEVTNPAGDVLARAEHTRFRVTVERFMQKLL